MNKLTVLRSRLNTLRRRRRLARWATGYSVVALVALWSALVIMGVDMAFNLSRGQRVMAWLIWAAAVGFGFLRGTWPWLWHRETALDLALVVERHEHIDGDLVAALEFESPQAASWGSARLRGAVIDYVGEFAPHLDLARGMTNAPARSRTLAFATSAAIVLLAGLCWPYHFRAFADRMLLGGAHYPVRTQIEQVSINGVPVRGIETTRSPYGEPVVFEIHGSGKLPETGTLELETLADGAATALELVAVEGQLGVYQGSLPRLVDDVRYRVLLGDDWTEPAELRAIPLPVVTLGLEPSPPEYAAGAGATSVVGGARQLSVIEGTSVAVRLECTNKSLREARLTIGEAVHRFAPSDSRRREWRFDPRGTPLARVTEPVHYEVQVLDDDGLALSEPIAGFIRIKADRPPRVTLALVTRHVLPTGKPTVTYGAADDYGIAELKLNVQIVHETGAIEERSIEVPAIGSRDKIIQGRLPLELSAMQLVKGDQLKLTLEAEDYRGRQPGKATTSEPLVIQVTDERGVLAAMAESDQRSARQLDSIIERQLGIGD
jgi:hypothetical protein